MNTYDKFAGVWVAMVSPWDENTGQPRKAVLRLLIERFLDAGVTGLFILGTTGEGFLFDLEERKRLAEIILEEVSGKLPVIVHVGHDRTKFAIELARHAKQIGAFAISVAPPARYKLDKTELVGYFVQIANAVEEIPVLLYDIPSATCNSLGAALIVEAHKKAPNIVGAKISRADWEAWQSYLCLSESFVLLVGNDLLCLPLLVMGASGIVSGPANIMPELYVELYQALCVGDIEMAKYWQAMISQLCDAVHYGRPLAFIKEAMRLLGFDVGSVVAPLRGLNQHELIELEQSLSLLRQGIYNRPKGGES